MNPIEFRLRALKVHLDVSIRKLCRYLEDETQDEDILLQMIYRMEYQEEQLKWLLKEYFKR